MVDGKKMKVEDVAAYHQGESTRTRGRTRGGSKVRTKASWLQLEAWFHLLLNMCVWDGFIDFACVFPLPSMDDRVLRKRSPS